MSVTFGSSYFIKSDNVEGMHRRLISNSNTLKNEPLYAQNDGKDGLLVLTGEDAAAYKGILKCINEDEMSHSHRVQAKEALFDACKDKAIQLDIRA